MYKKYEGSSVPFFVLLLLLSVQRSDGNCYAVEDLEQCVRKITCIESIADFPYGQGCQRIDEYGSEDNFVYYITLAEFSSPQNTFYNNWIDSFRSLFDNNNIIINSLILRNNSFFISPLTSLGSFFNIKIMDLSHNFIKEFNIDSLREHNILFNLDLSHNYISEVTGRGVSGVRYMSSVQRTGQFLKILNLSHNTIKKLEDGIFSHFLSLETLDLSSNLLTTIRFSTFKGLDQLQDLNISFNYLQQLDLALFESRNLKYLDVSYNRLTTLYKQDLVNVAYLKELNLQNNSLNSLPADMFATHIQLERLNLSLNSFGDSLGESMFKHNINLRCIDLSFIGMSNLVRNAFSSQNLERFKVKGNRLSGGLVTEYFNGLSRVTSLDLSHHYFTSIGNHTFTGADSLEVLDLSHNDIYVIEVKAFVSLVNLTSIDLSFNRLTVLDFDHVDLMLLNILRVNQNLIKNINEKTFENLNELEELDISENEIEYLPTNSLQLPCLRRLHFMNNTISKIDSNAFNKLIHISEMDMSFFRLSKILNDTFIGLDSVTKLNVSNNRIRVIEESAFRGLQNLTTLDVSNNFLEVFAINTSHVPTLIILKLYNNRLWNIQSLHNLQHLEFLDLANNKLSLNADSFAASISLKEIILSNNSLSADFCVSNSTDLRLLDLTMNKIEALNFADNSITHLGKIMLSSNRIRNITRLNLKNNSLVQEIDLSRNDIYNIETASFADLGYLAILDLSFNLVSMLNPGVFIDLQALEVLNISHNTIKEIKIGAFNGLKDLQILDLSFNEIVQIHKDIFFPLHLISSIVLDYNKINAIEDLDSFSYSMMTISIGDNPLDCTWLGSLVRSSRESMFKYTISSLNKNYTGENFNGITCIRKLERTDNSRTHLNIPTNNTVTEYDIRPHLSNLTFLLENFLKNNGSLVPRQPDVSLAPFLSKATNLLQKILNKNYSFTVEKSNVEYLKKYYEQVETQNANMRDILDQLRGRSNITDKNVRSKTNSEDGSTVITKSTSISDRELLSKIDKLYSIINELNKNTVNNLKNDLSNELFRNFSLYLDRNRLRSGQLGYSREPVSQPANDKLSAEVNQDNYASHIKLTEACVVIILIVMLAVIAYKLYLSRALSASSRLQSQSTQHIQMD